MVSLYDPRKFEAVLHYIINKCGTQDNTGKTVLWKLLYFSDFDYYELYEKHLTGENYFKLPRGPAPSHFDKAIESLKKKEKIKEISAKYGGYPQQKYLSLGQPDISQLSAEEIKVIDRAVQRLSAMTATQISNYSHLDTPWKATEDSDKIDYELVFYREGATSVREYSDDV